MYLWNIEYNAELVNELTQHVVNCFELCIFEILNTTWCQGAVLWNMLWIALNYVSLKYWIQHTIKFLAIREGCELLWIMYLWNIEYNTDIDKERVFHVVNCFELCIFEILNTTYQRENNDVRSCELLWIMYLWNIEYNTQKPRMFCCAVVNCFELCIFEILNTTFLRFVETPTSCELLWIMYLWNIEYNKVIHNDDELGVVNCFELCIFEILNTTLISFEEAERCCELLWIMYLWNIEYNLIQKY